MIAVSDNFKTAMKAPVKELQAYLGDIKSDDDLISFKISCDTGLCKTAMRKLEAKFSGEHNLLGQLVHVGYGVRLPDGTFEYLDYGSFLINEITTSKDTGITSVVGYDKMINAMTNYTPLEVEYPINLLNYTKILCEACGLELGNSVFGKNVLKNITSYTWVNNSSATHEIIDDYIKISMPETPSQYSGIYSGEVKSQVSNLLGKKMVFSFYAKADADRTIMFQSAGNASYVYINLTTEWQRFSYIIDSVEDVSPTFYCGDTLDTTSYYIKDIMLEETTILTDYKPYNKMNDWEISKELWENIDGITYRDILVQIAQVTGSTCIISNDDKVYFKSLHNTGEQLTYDNMFKLKLEPVYGEINSVVLSREPITGEDVFLKDDDSINTNGLTEYNISNNEIVDKDRENAIEPIYNSLKGISYTPFETTTEGLGWYEIADSFDIINDTGDVYNTSLFNLNISVDGGIKETLKTSAETKTQSQYQYASTISKRIKNAEIIVNKQEQYIEQLVRDMYDEGGVVNESFTNIYQNIENIVNSVQTSGGNNLIKNSVMFAYDNDGIPSDWELEGDGTLAISASAEALSSGGVSGHEFTVAGKIVRQKISVSENNYYTFSTRIKKDLTGTCYVKLYNSKEEHIIELGMGESAYYKEYELKALQPKDNYYIVEFYGSADSNATFTDNMLSIGDYKTQWTQANGEIMNTQVNINIDGILVKSSVYLGDYTVMSPLEFAGYSNINGVITKVFSLNKATTLVKKLEAEDEVQMVPIKIVPITSGELQGWAFVPSTTEEV